MSVTVISVLLCNCRKYAGIERNFVIFVTDTSDCENAITMKLGVMVSQIILRVLPGWLLSFSIFHILNGMV